MTKIIAAVVVIIIVVAAIAGALLLMGGGEEVAENQEPNASASATTTTIVAGDPVTFDATESEDPDGEIVAYSRNFGDGSVDISGPVVTHTYGFPGRYMIVLTVEDDKGGRSTNWNAPVRVEVLNPVVEEPSDETAPYAIAAKSGDLIESDTQVDFDAMSSAAFSEGEMLPDFISSIIWYFGDGSDLVSGSLGDVGLINHTYEGNGSVYASYIIVASIHGVVQLYYNTIVVLPTGGVAPVEAKNPDTFVLATIGEPESVDPGYNYESAGGEVLQNIYETLIWFDREKSAEFVPYLSTNVPTIENGGVSPDGLDYTFYLRQGVKFHDGTTMDAYDVEFSLERVLIINDPWSPAWMLGQVMVPGYGADLLDPDDVDASVEVVNSTTVVIHLVKPYPAFIKALAYTVGSVMSMEWAEANGGVSPGELNEFILRNEAGTGPYFMREWVSNQYILLERFDDYWRDLPELKYVIIKKIEDIGTREMMLFAGDADSIYVPMNHKYDVLDKPNIRIVQGLPTYDLTFIGFNQNINPGPLPIGTVPLDFFADPLVRQAFVRAFDYETYIVDILYGAAIVPNGPIPRGMWGYNETVPTFENNLTEAADFLEMAINADTGNSWAEDGFEVYLYYNSGNLVRETACLLFKENLESLTVDGYVSGDIVVNVQALDWSGAYLPAVRNRELPIFYLGWGPDYDDPDDYVQPFLHENGTYPFRISLFNHTLSLMIEEAAGELNETLRAQMYYEISMSCYENAYYIWLGQPTNFHVEREWVTGYYFNPLHSGLYYYVLGKGAA